MSAGHDVALVRNGPGGYVAAIRAAQLSLRTAIVAKQFWGGVCLNIGCIPFGVEFAYLLSGYQVDVTLVEVADRILPGEDPDVSCELAKQMQRIGARVFTGAQADAIEDTGSLVRATIALADGSSQVIEADTLMQSIGFQPNSQGFGLHIAGVRLASSAAIEIGDDMHTRVPNIFAIGNVTGKLMLAYVAEAMGTIVAERIAGAPSVKLDYDMMPRATFCQPQVASFGYTESQPKSAGWIRASPGFPCKRMARRRGWVTQAVSPN